ncbi:MAG: flagellar hook-associated protein FlgL [Gemmatimonadota bacterium]
MRITNQLLQRRVLRDLQATTSQLADAQAQASTGQRLSRVSDDPFMASTVMRIDRDLRGLDQYRRNVSAIRSRLDVEESVLDQVSDILTRAREIATEQASANANASTRQSAAAEVNRMLEQVIALGNTQVGSIYIFGGTQTATPPFQANGTYVGDTTTRQAEIGAGMVVGTNHTGDQIFVASNVIAGLTALRDALQTGDASQVGGTLAGLVSAFDATQVTLADLGARIRQLDVAGQNMDALEGALALRRRDAAEVPLEEAATRFVALQNALNAALATASRVLATSLAERL